MQGPRLRVTPEPEGVPVPVLHGSGAEDARTSSAFRGLRDRGPGLWQPLASPGPPAPTGDRPGDPSVTPARCLGSQVHRGPALIPTTSRHWEPSSARGGRAPVALSLPGWRLVSLCPRCPACSVPFHGRWHLIAPSALAACCLGRCSPTSARPGGTGVALAWCHGPVLCPSGWGLWRVTGTARLG